MPSLVQIMHNPINDVIKIEVWFWMQQAHSWAIEWKHKRLIDLHFSLLQFLAIYFSLFEIWSISYFLS